LVIPDTHDAYRFCIDSVVKSIELSIQNKKDLFNRALSSLDGLRENDISMYQKLEKKSDY